MTEKNIQGNTYRWTDSSWRTKRSWFSICTLEISKEKLINTDQTMNYASVIRDQSTRIYLIHPAPVSVAVSFVFQTILCSSN